MSKFNSKKTGFESGEIAGTLTPYAGKYTKEQLLRRVTLTNLLFESNYYQSSDEIMNQIESLVKEVDPKYTIDLAIEIRFEQKLRHTPLWLLILVNQYHKGASVKKALGKIANRPDMVIDVIGMCKVRYGKLHIPKGIKKGLALAFDNYNEYQIAKYKKTNLEISLIDVINLVHPKPTQNNAEALRKLVKGESLKADTWETALSEGGDKKEVFERMIKEKTLGSMAILRNIRNMKESGISRSLIKEGISQVKSKWLTPLNFLSAQRIAPEYTSDIDDAMSKCFEGQKIKGTTILAIDVSGSMGSALSSKSEFRRIDLAFALASYGSYIFEDLILVFTAGSDATGIGYHSVYSSSKGLGIFNDFNNITRSHGGGGIFTYQLCEWLKKEGYAKDAERIVVISDSQDIDFSRGRKNKPDTSPYKHSYIIDISTNTHGIKTGNWTAEINGVSDKVFHYISALEKSEN